VKETKINIEYFVERIDLLEQGGINTLFLSLSFSVKKIQLGIFVLNTKLGNKKMRMNLEI
jgi:hypothetical protein